MITKHHARPKDGKEILLAVRRTAGREPHAAASRAKTASSRSSRRFRPSLWLRHYPANVHRFDEPVPENVLESLAAATTDSALPACTSVCSPRWKLPSSTQTRMSVLDHCARFGRPSAVAGVRRTQPRLPQRASARPQFDRCRGFDGIPVKDVRLRFSRTSTRAIAVRHRVSCPHRSREAAEGDSQSGALVLYCVRQG
jgi:hypothetical protein